MVMHKLRRISKEEVEQLLKDMIWACGICYKQFSDPEPLEEHLKEHKDIIAFFDPRKEELRL